MAIIAFASAETGVISDEINTVGTTPTVFSGAAVKTGTYSYRTAATTTGTSAMNLLGYAADGVFTAFSIATAYTDFDFQVVTLPAANDEMIFRTRNSTVAKLNLRINSTGNLVVYDKDGILVATGATALSTGTWYRISIRSGNGTTATYTININGVQELTGTCNQLANNVTTVQFGKMANANGNTIDYYFDNMMVDDTAFQDTRTVIKLSPPNANGATCVWTTNDGGTPKWAYVSDNGEGTTTVSRDLNTYVLSTGAAGDVALFGTQTLNNMGISGATILSVMQGVIIREQVAATTSTKLRFVSGGTTTDTTGVDPSVTAGFFAQILNTDPNTSAAWKEAGFNAIEYGCIEANAVQTRLAWTGAFVVHTPFQPRGIVNYQNPGVF